MSLLAWFWRQGIQHNDFQDNGILHNNTQYKSVPYNVVLSVIQNVVLLSVGMLSAFMLTLLI
jgi:hypothetical protein